MKKTAILSLLVLIHLQSSGQAAQPGKPAETLEPADTEFSALLIAARPVPVSPPANGRAKTSEEFQFDRKVQSAGFAEAARKAKEFYTKYPANKRAAEAKRIEVISLFRAANTGAVELEPQAIRLAEAYRTDPSNPSADRFEVATTQIQNELLRKNVTSREKMVEEYDARAMDLYGEFPSEPRVFDLFLGIARTAGPAKSREYCERLLNMPAPVSVKEEAQAILDRMDMAGKPIALQWQDDSKKSHQISDYKGKIVVFYVWATWAQLQGDSHEESVLKLPNGVELVSVNVDTDVAKAKNAKEKSGLKAVSYFDDRGTKSPLSLQLRANRAPAVHVVNASGVYVGSGNPAELPALLAKAAL